jgi:hypothetical protein
MSLYHEIQYFVLFKKLISFNSIDLLIVKTPPKTITSFPMRFATFRTDIDERGCVTVAFEKLSQLRLGKTYYADSRDLTAFTRRFVSRN